MTAPDPASRSPRPGASMAVGSPPGPALSQPKTIKLSAHALRALPHRLAHPPPARGILASWSVTPRVSISLEDVLDRKHLPPLGLKDFEEWLLFVEQSAENLYFVLWLREYTARYADWVHHTRSTHARPSSAPSTLSHAPQHLPRSPPPTYALPAVPLQPYAPYTTSSSAASSPSSRRPRPSYRTPRAPLPPNPALAAFYLRAKHTFLTPKAPYELDVPSDALQVFHAPAVGGGVDGMHPPDPAIFDELADHVTAMLRESLDRFVRATFNNVGAPRAWCGCAGGVTIALMGSAPPLAASFATGGPRWWRLLALPGMWLGLTIFISAMYGVCMMIYIFGDLRQLRSFELVRAPIGAALAAKAAPSGDKEKAALTQLDAAPPPLHRLPAPETKRPLLRIVPPAFSFALLGVRSSPAESERAHEAQLDDAIAGAVTRRPASAHSRSSGPSFASASEARASMESFVVGLGDEDANADSKSALHEDDVTEGYGCRRTESPTHVDEEEEEEDGSDSETASSCSAPSTSSARIEISDAFYDADPAPEGPATCPRAAPAYPALTLAHPALDSETSLVLATAGFIRPFVWDGEGPAPSVWGRDDVEAAALPRADQDPFDFDALPPRRPRFANPHRRPAPPPIRVNVALPPSPRPAAQVQFSGGAQPGASTREMEKERESRRERGKGRERDLNTSTRERRVDLRSILGHAQSACSPANAVRPTLQLQARARLALAAGESLPASPTLTLAGPASPLSPALKPPSVLTLGSPVESVDEKRLGREGKMEGEKGREGWHSRFRRVSMVPPFAAPLTPILSPVVTRAQWEIVVRSALVAALVSCAAVGALLGVPPGR
ncbi:hypothetical protein CERSUDRAFT_112188 [Gelatoporia subvermispora B]|uniref:RGS domain-containing protein n=1 Tax=Ceriporiopsis subvermispora (strain B) TaxID=914234 RepID=M2PTE2_CERS8|nr:hypothetical protein CERSUDRAFT_112188 [Gelatoporia subvermispora B]